MWKKVLNYIVVIFLIICLIIIGILGYLNYKYVKSLPEIISLHDTITITKDSIIEKIKYVTEFDTVIDVQYKDTIIHDTVRLPIEHKVDSFTIKKDSLTINEKIHHSGFHSVVDSVELDYTWNYTFLSKKEKNIGLVWNVGLYAGYGINFNNGQYYFSPEIGIGGSIGIGGMIKANKPK